MRRPVLILLFLLCGAGLAHATIARGGAGSGATAATPSSSVPFQLEIAGSVRSGSTTAPSLPSGWTSILTKSGTSSSIRVQCRIEYSSAAAASGTFTNATNSGIVGYTGANARSVAGCATNGISIGANASSSGTSTTPSCPSLALTNTGGTSWVVCLVYNAGGSADMCTPLGMTAIAGATSGDVGVFDTGGTVTNFSAASCTNAASENWVTASVEILVPPPNPPTLPQLVNGDGGGYMYTYQSNPGNNFTRWIDPVAGSGNYEIFVVSFPYEATGRTLTISDDKGDSASLAAADASCNDSSNSASMAVLRLPLTAGATTFTFTFDSAVGGFTEYHIQLSGLAAGSVVTGTPSCTMGNSLSSAAALNNLADGTGTTPGVSGALIFSAFVDEYGLSNGQTVPSDVIWGSGFTGIYADTASTTQSEAQIQSAAALIKPGITVLQSGTYDKWGIATIAYKTSAGSGIARANGKILRSAQVGNISTGTSYTVQFPCDTGNVISFSFEGDSGSGSGDGPLVTSVVDSAGNTYVHQAPGAPSVTTVGSGLTSSTQTSIALAAAGGIANGDFLQIGGEVVQVVSGGGSTSLTVARAQMNSAALSSIASGTTVYDLTQNNFPQYWTATNAICNGQDFVSIAHTSGVSTSLIKAYEITGALTSGAIDAAATTSGYINNQAITNLNSAVTSATQTAFTLAAGAGIKTNQYLNISSEVVQCTAGCGTTSITVARGQLGTAALSSIGGGTSVFLSSQAPLPAVAASSNNEVVLAAMSNGTGPNWNSMNCTFDLGSYTNQADNITSYANGDGMCHAYVSTAAPTTLGYLVSNGGTSTAMFGSAIGIKLQSAAATTRHRAWVLGN
jgi:hypothetical protein